MSSSNLVRVTAIPEVTYGVTPGAGNFKTARFISEGLSGTPETTESAQIRVDRMSSGQVVSGLTVGGELSFELAKESLLEGFMESAMYNTFATQSLVTVDLEVDIVNRELTRASGTYSLVVGDFIKLSGFSNAVNNVEVMVSEVVSATVIKFVGPDTMVDEVGTGTTYKRADKLSIGTTKKSYSIEKAFLDLTNKAINYRGMIASEMNLNVSYGEIVNGSFTFSGNDYEAVDASVDFMTNGRTIDAAATTQSMNGSVDMPFLASGATGTLEGVTFCIQSLELSLNNNLNPLNCIGETAPIDYDAGTAQIEVSLSAYLSNANWELLQKKLTQEAFALGFIVKNIDGAYAFYLPAIQVSFDDPSSGGANQIISLEMSGTAKVGATGESALSIFKFA
jgi:hypothetical protein